MNTLNGLGVALVTPFTRNLKIDYTALERLLKHLYKSRSVDFLVVLGSTGEAATLSEEERQEVMNFVREYNEDRLPLVFGHSGNNTHALIKALQTIDYHGYSAILSATPAYVKPTQEGLYRHYTMLADKAPLPVILYNVPSRTGVNMAAGTVIRLAAHPNIIGVKESANDMIQAMDITNGTPKNFLLLSGDDLHTLPLIAVGASGLISVLANAYPKIFKEILTAGIQGDYSKAAKATGRIRVINDLMYREGNPVGIKQLLHEMDICQPYVRPPLVKATAQLGRDIRKALL